MLGKPLLLDADFFAISVLEGRIGDDAAYTGGRQGLPFAVCIIFSVSMPIIKSRY